MANRSELVTARKAGVFRDRRIEEDEVAPSQLGFSYVALLKVLQTAKHPEREKWIENFKNIKTEVDAALFMTEAKLKMNYEVDFNKILIDSARAERRTALKRKYRK